MNLKNYLKLSVILIAFLVHSCTKNRKKRFRMDDPILSAFYDYNTIDSENELNQLLPIRCKKPFVLFNLSLKSLLINKSDYKVLKNFILAILEANGYPSIEIDQLIEIENNKYSKISKTSLIEIERNEKTLFISKARCTPPSHSIEDHLGISKSYTNTKNILHIDLIYFPVGHIPICHEKTIFNKSEKEGRVNIEIRIVKEDITDRNRVSMTNEYNTLSEYLLISIPHFINKDDLKKYLEKWSYILRNKRLPDHLSMPYSKKIKEKLECINNCDSQSSQESDCTPGQYTSYFIEEFNITHNKNIKEVLPLPYTLISKGGHTVQLVEKESQWIAHIAENLPKGFSRTLKLPVQFKEGFDVNQLAKYDLLTQQHRVHIFFPEKCSDKKGFVYVGMNGLRGGGKDWIGKDKDGNRINRYMCKKCHKHGVKVAKDRLCAYCSKGTLAPKCTICEKEYTDYGYCSYNCTGNVRKKEHSLLGQADVLSSQDLAPPSFNNSSVNNSQSNQKKKKQNAVQERTQNKKVTIDPKQQPKCTKGDGSILEEEKNKHNTPSKSDNIKIKEIEEASKLIDTILSNKTPYKILGINNPNTITSFQMIINIFNKIKQQCKLAPASDKKIKAFEILDAAFFSITNQLEEQTEELLATVSDTVNPYAVLELNNGDLTSFDDIKNAYNRKRNACNLIPKETKRKLALKYVASAYEMIREEQSKIFKEVLLLQDPYKVLGISNPSDIKSFVDLKNEFQRQKDRQCGALPQTYQEKQLLQNHIWKSYQTIQREYNNIPNKVLSLQDPYEILGVDNPNMIKSFTDLKNAFNEQINKCKIAPYSLKKKEALDHIGQAYRMVQQKIDDMLNDVLSLQDPYKILGISDFTIITSFLDLKNAFNEQKKICNLTSNARKNRQVIQHIETAYHRIQCEHNDMLNDMLSTTNHYALLGINSHGAISFEVLQSAYNRNKNKICLIIPSEKKEKVSQRLDNAFAEINSKLEEEKKANALLKEIIHETDLYKILGINSSVSIQSVKISYFNRKQQLNLLSSSANKTIALEKLDKAFTNVNNKLKKEEEGIRLLENILKKNDPYDILGVNKATIIQNFQSLQKEYTSLREQCVVAPYSTHKQTVIDKVDHAFIHINKHIENKINSILDEILPVRDPYKILGINDPNIITDIPNLKTVYNQRILQCNIIPLVRRKEVLKKLNDAFTDVNRKIVIEERKIINNILNGLDSYEILGIHNTSTIQNLEDLMEAYVSNKEQCKRTSSCSISDKEKALQKLEKCYIKIKKQLEESIHIKEVLDKICNGNDPYEILGSVYPVTFQSLTNAYLKIKSQCNDMPVSSRQEEALRKIEQMYQSIISADERINQLYTQLPGFFSSIFGFAKVDPYEMLNSSEDKIQSLSDLSTAYISTKEQYKLATISLAQARVFTHVELAYNKIKEHLEYSLHKELLETLLFENDPYKLLGSTEDAIQSLQDLERIFQERKALLNIKNLPSITNKVLDRLIQAYNDLQLVCQQKMLYELTCENNPYKLFGCTEGTIKTLQDLLTAYYKKKEQINNIDQRSLLSKKLEEQYSSLVSYINKNSHMPFESRLIGWSIHNDNKLTIEDRITLSRINDHDVSDTNAILGINYFTSKSAAKTTWKNLTRLVHPDKNKSWYATILCQKLNATYDRKN